MDIIITKETKDLRGGNRTKILKVGTKFTCTSELADKYIKAKKGKLVTPLVKKIEPLKTVDEATAFYQNEDENLKHE